MGKYVAASTVIGDPPEGVAVYTKFPGTAGEADASSAPVPIDWLTCCVLLLGVQLIEVETWPIEKPCGVPEFDPVKPPVVA